MARTQEVFVAGGQPTVTFNPREHLQLSSTIKDYLETLYKVLSVSGPTKSGKTVLVRSVVPSNAALWIPGGQVRNIEDFWGLIVDRLQAFTSTTVTIGDSQEASAGLEASADLKIAGTGVSTKAQMGAKLGAASSLMHERQLPANIVGARALTNMKRPLVIDDFHYIDHGTQMAIIRALKDAVFDGLPVILISVPHRAFDAVRVEREMTGRIAQLQVPDWSDEDLRQIATVGFRALNLTVATELVDRLISESFSSPHLMQEFCGQICREHAVYETQALPITISTPVESWDTFFKKRASDASKRAFDQLATGPRKRTERIQRQMKDGSTMDIYKALLLAIARTGPKTRISYDQLRTALRELIVEPPQVNEIVRVLIQMSTIAKKAPGEPVVDYDKDMSTLHISDPYFAYYLRWGTKE